MKYSTILVVAVTVVAQLREIDVALTWVEVRQVVQHCHRLASLFVLIITRKILKVHYTSKEFEDLRETERVVRWADNPSQ